MADEKIIKEVRDYYDQKLAAHGASPAGVDWNSVESQELRYKILLKCTDGLQGLSLLDYGCGYGGMLDFIVRSGQALDYTGYDISEEMIREARSARGLPAEQAGEKGKWVSELTNGRFDFVVASGLFNVRLETPDSEWLDYIKDGLHEFNRLSKRAFAFNVLTSYSDADKKRDYLYYASPEELFAYCKKNFSRNVALLHDYDLYEFTIIVRKEA